MRNEIKFKDIFRFFKKNKKLLIYISLIIIILLSVYIRTRNVSGLIDVTTGKPTLAPDLDPYLFLRRARTIVEEGSLPEIDNMRYVAAQLSPKFNLNSYAIVFLYSIMSFFKDIEIESAGIWLPVIVTALSLIPLFFLVKLIFSFVNKTQENGKRNEITSSIIALLACLLLIISPGYLHRTIAGVPELEGLGMLFFFTAFLFFLLSWKNSKEGYRYLIYSLIAGIFTGLMWVTWGGNRFIFMSLGVAVLASYLFKKINTKKLALYSIWFFSAGIIHWILKEFPPLTDFSYAIAFFSFGVLIVDFAFRKIKLKEKIQKTKLNKIPYNLLVLLIIIIFGLILLSLIKSPGFILAEINDIKTSALHPFGLGRIGLTVAENRQPYFSEWANNFGPNLKGIPIFFWLFFLGSILLFKELVRRFEKKERIILNLTYIYFIVALIFSRYSSSSLFNGSSFIAVLFYYSGFLLLLISFLYIYFKDENKFKKLNFYCLFMLVLFFWTIIGARGAVRLFFLLTPTASILASFFVVRMVQYSRKARGEGKRLFLVVVAIILILLLSLIIIPSPNFVGNMIGMKSFTQDIMNNAVGTRPGIYEQQWQKAMAWVRENTPKDAVFGHWWDYGYWVQYLGERASDTDGGHQITWWDHLNGRYVLTAENEKTTLQYLKAHNVTHFLIDPTDIGKYGAYSSIGGNNDGDRQSFIAKIELDNSQTLEEKNKKIYVYPAGIPLDEDFKFFDVESGKELLFPGNDINTYILGFVFETENEIPAGPPKAAIYNQGNRYFIEVRYLFYNEDLIDFETGGLQATLYIIPKIEELSGGGIQLNKIGSALYLSERVTKTQFVRLYLFDETENFELIYKEPDPIIGDLKRQGLEGIGDFASFHGFRGPIKIWKINYPLEIKYYDEYLKIRGEYGDLDYLGI